jgi:ABC-type lipoprotein export system ATPase subunit
LTIDNTHPQIQEVLSEDSKDERLFPEVKNLTIIGGTNKSGDIEPFSICCQSGDIICLVGPTGSGKSRMLGDIESLAQGDTPSGRKILINGEVPAPSLRTSAIGLIAQLSQQMNFVVDLKVREFIALHVESRLIPDPEKIVDLILKTANGLSGEQFSPDVSLTQLSGGQSRALMIADTALLCPSPVVLIDEIENAGVNRKKALELLVKEGKITFVATHDPVLALMGSRRLFFKNGGIAGIIIPDEEERLAMGYIQKVDDQWTSWRDQIRNGGVLHMDDSKKEIYDRLIL